MKRIPLSLLFGGVALLALAPSVQAQPTAHYVPGIEGIKGASMPPPGVYLRNYNVFYWADRLNDDSGNKIAAADPDAFVYANVPRLLWITEMQVLEGFIGFDVLLPIQYTDLSLNTPGGRFDDSTWGIGDFFAEVTWSRRLARFDVAAGYGLWMPTGDSAPGLTTRAGLGFWTHMFTAGATWYPDADRKWSVSALNRYEINHRKRYTNITPGDAYTLELGVGYALRPTIEFGPVAYYQVQTTSDSGRGAPSEKDMVWAVGPEINVVWAKLDIITSVRYLREIESENRLQGNTATVTLTKRF